MKIAFIINIILGGLIMNEEMDMQPDLYTLVDEEGQEQMFELLDSLEYEGETYYALTPYLDDAEAILADDGEVVILKSTYEGDEEVLVSVDDDDLFDKLGDMFMDRFAELFEDGDEDSVEIEGSDRVDLENGEVDLTDPDD